MIMIVIMIMISLNITSYKEPPLIMHCWVSSTTVHWRKLTTGDSQGSRRKHLVWMDLLLASVGHSTSAITWDIVKRFTKDDETNNSLTKWISAGCPGPVSDLPENVRQFWRVRDQLRVHDGVPMMSERIIVPEKLRPRVLETLH